MRIETSLVLASALAFAGVAQAFTLVSKEAKARIVVGEKEPECVWLAASDLTNDVKKIAGVDLELVRGTSAAKGDVFVATAKSDRWEAYSVKESDGVLRISGSDERGTMFGVYDFIERYLGVDPMWFWSGVPHPRKETLAWEKVGIDQPSPSFRFRGWFLNDEDFINSWKPYAGDRRVHRGMTFIDKVMSHETLEHVLEALVRCRMNMIIPSSYFDPGNPADAHYLDRIAARGVYVTQHHHDPLGLSGFMFDNKYKRKGVDKTYSYHSSPKEMEEMWRYAAKIYAKHPNVIWQIGMRGHSDSPTWRSDPTVPKTDEGRAKVISDAMAAQIGILKEIGVPEDNFHVTATLWGEGSYFNRRGLLKVPEGSMIIFSDNSTGWAWPEDFYKTERKPGYRYGIYYHHQIWTCGPHCMTAIPVTRTYKLLREAYDTKANEYVVFNVSNLREFCYGIDNSAKMTWNIESFACDRWQREWIARGVGAERADEWSSVFNLYFKSFARHPLSDGPCFLDGQLSLFAFVRGWQKDLNRFEGVIPEIKDKIKRMSDGKVRIPHEPAVDAIVKETTKDPMEAALLPMVHPRMISMSDNRRRAASQQAGFAQALVYAQALLKDVPAERRDFAFDQLVFPIRFMSLLTDAYVSLLDADFALDVADRATARAKVSEARVALGGIAALGKLYCHGKWQGWWRLKGVHQRFGLMGLINKVDGLAKSLED